MTDSAEKTLESEERNVWE